MRRTLSLAAVCLLGWAKISTVGGAAVPPPTPSNPPAPTGSPAAAKVPAKPNIIFVLTDDLGYGDLGTFFQNQRKVGANPAAHPSHVTPNLDAMAAGGLRLTDHYCPAPVCAPSRASLLLGVHQGHANVRDNQFDKALEDNHTLGTVLRQAGYATAAVGKWGLQGKAGGGADTSDEEEKPAAAAEKADATTDKADGPAAKPDGPAAAKAGQGNKNAKQAAKAAKQAKNKPGDPSPDWPAHPLNRGFDSYYGYMRHSDGHEHYPKEGVYRQAKQVWDGRTEVSDGLDKCYTTDLFAARAKKWVVDQHAAKPQQPFFMYLAFDTPHAVCELPTQAFPAGRGLKGGLQWLGTPGHMINTASGTVDGWYHPDYANATWDDDNNPATPEVPWPDVYKRYATSVRRIDDAVGDLLHLLKDLKIDDDTLVVFASDNGPSIESYLKEPYRPTFFGSFGPFDGIKRDCWEGGMRVPTIARWPAAVPAGRTSGLPSSFADWMPTFAAAAGVAPPARSDGVSLLPTLTGKGAQATPRVYVEYFVGGKTPNFGAFEPTHRDRVRKQMQAIRLGDLIGVRYDIAKASDDFEIYNAVTDPKEAHDLGKQPAYAAVQKQMKETVLQVRRPGGAATRPYDGELVPAIAAAPVGGKPVTTEPGLAWSTFTGPFPWAPQFDGLAATASGVTVKPSLAELPKDKDLGCLFTGFLDVPADGSYTLSLTASAGAVLRLHEATVVDADFKHAPGAEVSGTILLKAGRHPIRISYAGGSKSDPTIKLAWSGPGVEKQDVPATALSHAVTGKP